MNLFASLQRYFFLLLFGIFVLLTFEQSRASGWSWNLGVNNPPGSTLGVNFMHLASNWAFELGIGGVQQSKGIDSTTNQETKAVSVLGDINLKYLFNGKVIRPYVQLGAGSSASIITNSGTSAGVGIGGGYFGGGLFFLGNPVYGYISYNSGGGAGHLQYGLGAFF